MIVSLRSALSASALICLSAAWATLAAGQATPPQTAATDTGDSQAQAQAQAQAQQDATPPPTDPRQGTEAQGSWWRTRAEQLTALMDGKLAADIDERTLFLADMGAWPATLAKPLGALLRGPGGQAAGASQTGHPSQTTEPSADGSGGDQARRDGQAPEREEPPSRGPGETTETTQPGPTDAESGAGAQADTATEARTGAPDGNGADGTATEGPRGSGVDETATEGPRAWLAALERWAALTPQARAALLAQHGSRREAAAAERQLRAARDKELAALKRETADLKALLAGTLPLEQDPSALLIWDLARWPTLSGATHGTARGQGDTGDSNKGSDQAGDKTAAKATKATRKAKSKKRTKKRAKKTEQQGKGPGGDAPGEAGEPEATAQVTPVDPELQAARAALQSVRTELLTLSPEARQELLDNHRARRVATEESEVAAAHAAANAAEREAQAAAEARKRALLAAEQARTEAQRVIAAEHARLLGIDEAQARFGAKLSQEVIEAEHFHRSVTEQRLQAEALTKPPETAGAGATEADSAYEGLLEGLAATRKRLGKELDAITSGKVPLPRVGDLVELPRQPEATEVRTLHDRLSKREKALLTRTRDQRWQEALALRQDMSGLNRARLELLGWLSPEARARYLGSGPAAMRQASSEAEQIRLEVRVKALALPRELGALQQDLMTAPLPVILGFFQLVTILAIFRAWRRNAETWLTDLRRRVLRAKPPWPLQSQVAIGLWYAMRIRKPLETLFVVAVLIGLLGPVGEELGLGYVWVVATWGLTGSAVVRFLDALAARQHLRSGGSSSAVLRVRSLRLVGVLAVFAGMLLSLVALTVGEGTLYGWVSRICWLLTIPVGAVLIRWWRPTVLARIGARTEETLFFNWVKSHTRGPRSYLTATAGGFYLLAEGLMRWVMTEASEWELTRRLLAYLFRTEAARKAQAQGPTRTGRPLDEARSSSLAPEQVRRIVLSEVWGDRLKDLVEGIEGKSCTLAVVTGERGIGKTIFLEKLSETLEGEAIRFACPTDGLPGLLMRMRKTLDLGAMANDTEIASAIDERAPKVVIIDDMQRAIRPAIGGLSPLDRIVSMARESSRDIAWVLAIASPAWNYVERARSERIAFDRTVTLKGWSEEHIGTLIRASSSIANIEPNFERLVMTRQMEAVAESASGRAEKGYYRMLWDFSGGNPALALHWFRRSLFIDNDGQVGVGLFNPPDAWDLEEVPLNVRFVLRAVLQLDWAHPSQLADSLEMSRGQVDETLRFAQSRGYLERQGDRVTIAWEWLRAITVALKRQHLITT